MKKHEDYYHLLGVRKDATKQDIQRSYRKLARKYHPDMNSDKKAEEMFKQINQAHSTLIDPEQRKLYDLYGPNRQEAQHHQYHQEGGTDGTDDWQEFTSGFNHEKRGNPFEKKSHNDFFSHFFSGEKMAGRSYDGFYDNRGADIEAELQVTLAELFACAKKSISWTAMQVSAGDVKPQVQSVEVKLPRGLKEGSVIRLAGKGGKVERSGKDGDLLLHIRIIDDPRFRVQDYDLVTILMITPWEAALGGKVEVQTVNGRIQLNLPKGTSSGKKLRIGGKGLPKKNSDAGDLLVEIQVHVPKELSEKEQQLFRDLEKISDFNPRSVAEQRTASVKTEA